MTARVFLLRRNFCEGGCSMRITEDVGRYAAEKGLSDEAAIKRGLQEKAVEFARTGDVYGRV